MVNKFSCTCLVFGLVPFGVVGLRMHGDGFEIGVSSGGVVGDELRRMRLFTLPERGCRRGDGVRGNNVGGVTRSPTVKFGTQCVLRAHFPLGVWH